MRKDSFRLMLNSCPPITKVPHLHYTKSSASQNGRRISTPEKARQFLFPFSKKWAQKKKKCWTPRSKKPQCRYGLSNSQTRYLESSGLKRSIDWICHAQVMGRSTVALLAAFINIIRGSAHNNSYCEPCKGLHSLRWKRVRRTVPGIRYWIHSVLAAFTNGDWERVLSGSDG